MSKFQVTTAAKKLLKLKKKIKVVPGGTSAGKTYNILPILFSKAAKTPNLSISVVSETMPHIRKGAMRDFLNVLESTERFNPKFWHKTNSTYTLANGSFIEFFSLENEGKARGPRRDILYVNEANLIKFELFYQMLIRTKKEIWIDFNPSEKFWAHDELENHPDAEWLTLTYKDNEALDASIVREIELNKEKAYFDLSKPKEGSNIKSEYWHNWWQVYGLGLTGQTLETIFPNWSQIDNIPKDAIYQGTGLDFGFSHDPTAIVDMYLYNGKKLFHEVVSKTGMGINETVEHLKGKHVIADRSNPLLIKEIKNRGVNIKAYDATDGKGAISYGIEVLQSDEFLVTSESLNLIKELRRYVWERDKNGELTGSPAGEDHCIDAMRYIGSTGSKKVNYGTRRKRPRPVSNFGR